MAAIKNVITMLNTYIRPWCSPAESQTFPSRVTSDHDKGISLELLKYLQGHIIVSLVQGDRRQFLRELAAILTQFALADAI